MVYRIVVESIFLKAELFDRESMEETRSFFRVVGRESAVHERPFILIINRSSTPILRVEFHALVETLKELGHTTPLRIALLGEVKDLGVSQHYVTSYARQRGITVRSFSSEEQALSWFSDRRLGTDRRLRRESRKVEERRGLADRRRHGHRNVETYR
jgi:hypothetical protein